ncbi:MAG: hypothetical protein SOH81_05630 [Acetobacter sp.]|jgi:hypothetical protein
MQQITGKGIKVTDEFNLYEYIYTSKVQRIRTIYQLSINGILLDLENWKKREIIYKEKIKNGYKETPLQQNGNIIFFPEEEDIRDDINIILDLINITNKNFMVSIYQNWERYWYDFFIKTHDHKELTNYKSISDKIRLHYAFNDGIVNIKNIANAIKHGNKETLNSLRKHFPDMFRLNDGNEDFIVDTFGSEAINITKARVEWAFDVIMEAGPRSIKI